MTPVASGFAQKRLVASRPVSPLLQVRRGAACAAGEQGARVGFDSGHYTCTSPLFMAEDTWGASYCRLFSATEFCCHLIEIVVVGTVHLKFDSVQPILLPSMVGGGDVDLCVCMGRVEGDQLHVLVLVCARRCAGRSLAVPPCAQSARRYRRERRAGRGAPLGARDHEKTGAIARYSAANAK